MKLLLQITQNGLTHTLPLNPSLPLELEAQADAQYQIIDAETGRAVDDVMVMEQNGELHFVVENRTHLILYNYSPHHASVSEVLPEMTTPKLASTVGTSTSKMGLLLGGMATLGGAVALASGGQGNSNDAPSETTSTDAPTTDQAISHQNNQANSSPTNSTTNNTSATIPHQSPSNQTDVASEIKTAKGESVKAEPLPEGKLPEIETAKGTSVKAEPLPEGKLPDIETAKGESVKAEPLPEGKLPDIETAKGESVKAKPLPEGKLPDIETAKGTSVKAEPLPEGKLPEIETAKGESVKAEPLPEGKLPEIETAKGTSVKAEPLPEEKLPEIETAKGESVKAESLPEGVLPDIETAKGTSIKAEPLPEGKLPEIETAKGESAKAEPLPEGKLPDIETAKGESVKAEPLPEGVLPDIETAKGESVKADPLPEGKLPTTPPAPTEETAQIRLVEINHADATQTIRVTGKFELDGIFAKFKNPQQLEGITLKIGDKQYTAGIDKTNQTFYTDIPIADIESLKGQAIEYEIAHLPIYEEPRYQDRERGYKLWAFEHTKPTAKHVILDDHPLLTQRDGDQYRIQNDVSFEPQATLRGTVSGTAKVGDLVQVQMGEHRYETHVQEGNTFELQVAETALLAHQGQPIVATLHANDVSGSLKTVQHQTEYSTAPITDGAWVAKFDTAVAEPAYFIRGIDSRFAWGFLSRHQVGQDHTTLKYYLFDAERENVTNGNIVSFTEQNHTILKTQVLDLISKYANITFEQHYGLPGTDVTFYMQNITYTPGRSVYGSEVGFSKYTFQEGGRTLDSPKGFHIAAHEFMHTLGAKHPHEDVITLKPDQEDLYGLTIMSYQLGSGYEFSTPYRDLRIFDLAYLHYRYNVNPNTRAGNDVYTFKNFNPHSVDGDIYIWDGSGVDTFDASAEKQGVTVDLTPGSWIYSGEKASNLVMTSHSLYSNHDYFDKGHWVQFLPNEQVEGYQATFAKGQAFIGYGTQIENLIGSDHADTLTGNVADNAIYGRAGDDTIRGGAGNDYLDGGSGSDHLHGGLGNDIFVVQQDGDQVHELANEGTDTVHAYINYTLGEHVEHLSLFGLATTATGNSENNTLRGNALDNTLNGMDGNDRLDAGVGNNTLTGGNGQDTFVFSSLLDGGVDTVTDFNTAEDKIALARSVFTAVNADNVLQQIAYNSETGALSYQSVQFATLSTGLDLQNTHFELV